MKLARALMSIAAFLALGIAAQPAHAQVAEPMAREAFDGFRVHCLANLASPWLVKEGAREMKYRTVEPELVKRLGTDDAWYVPSDKGSVILGLSARGDCGVVVQDVDLAAFTRLLESNLTLSLTSDEVVKSWRTRMYAVIYDSRSATLKLRQGTDGGARGPVSVTVSDARPLATLPPTASAAPAVPSQEQQAAAPASAPASKPAVPALPAPVANPAASTPAAPASTVPASTVPAPTAPATTAPKTGAAPRPADNPAIAVVPVPPPAPAPAASPAPGAPGAAPAAAPAVPNVAPAAGPLAKPAAAGPMANPPAVGPLTKPPAGGSAVKPSPGATGAKAPANGAAVPSQVAFPGPAALEAWDPNKHNGENLLTTTFGDACYQTRAQPADVLARAQQQKWRPIQASLIGGGYDFAWTTPDAAAEQILVFYDSLKLRCCAAKFAVRRIDLLTAATRRFSLTPERAYAAGPKQVVQFKPRKDYGITADFEPADDGTDFANLCYAAR